MHSCEALTVSIFKDDIGIFCAIFNGRMISKQHFLISGKV